MGLDIACATHGFRAGSYSGFGAFRDWLARQIGDKDYDDYCSKTEEIVGDWGDKVGMSKLAHKAFLGPLMWHSDCDGYIGPKNAQVLLDNLETVKAKLKPMRELKLSRIENKEEGESPYEAEVWFRAKLEDWITVCKDAIEDNHKIWFG